MIVQGGKIFLGQSGAQGSKRSNKDDQNNFQDLLVGAKKKKAPIDKAGKKNHDIKKKTDQDGYDEVPQVAKRKDIPKKKVLVPTEKKNAVSATKKPEVNPVKQEKTQETAQPPLEKNQKIMQSLENSFEEMMAKVNSEAATKEGTQSLGQEINKGIGQSMQNKLAGLNKINGGQIKIGAEMNTAEAGETFSLQNGEGLAGVKTLAKEGGESHQDTGARDLSSMFGQQIEQESQFGDVEGVQFGEELTMAEGGKSEKIENVQNIVKQARAFVDDGGGSMEIHLQPEGLGKIQLKVAVQDGQVNVEMLTDNLNAKKALEEGLIDIKSALEGQKLLVETLKVEMAQDYQKDFSDLADHMQEQANKDFAEQFLGQFKQEREERFGGMFDSFKNFQPNRPEPELTLNRNPYAENGKGRSINLVA